MSSCNCGNKVEETSRVKYVCVWCQGRTAAVRGRPLKDNPYDQDDVESYIWDDGWYNHKYVEGE